MLHYKGEGNRDVVLVDYRDTIQQAFDCLFNISINHNVTLWIIIPIVKQFHKLKYICAVCVVWNTFLLTIFPPFFVARSKKKVVT